MQQIETRTSERLVTTRRKETSVGFFSKSIVRLILAVWGVCVLFPMVWTLYTSFKSDREFFASAWALPKHWQLSNYVTAWNQSNVAADVWHSVFVAVIASALALFMSATSSYALARFRFRGRNVLFGLYIGSMMIPSILGLIPLFFLLSSLGLLNSLIGLAIVYGVQSVPFGVFILTGFFKSLPKELEESAAMDGAGHFRTFFQIMLPLSKSGLITVAIMNMLNYWNEYFLSMVFVQDPHKYTLPVGIAFMVQTADYNSDWGSVFAALIISMLPLIVLYSIFQKRITEGMTAGSIKG